jgi:RNA polymerase sigma factor (sigma-70 family)
LFRRGRAAVIRGLQVAAWIYSDPDGERDSYLRQLLEDCHRRGILVFAWLELPHVSEKFWLDHPEWREQTAARQDAHLDWRKLMNLANPECFRAAAEGVGGMLRRFDWDGVNLAELYFESLQGQDNPSRFTPFNQDVRGQLRARSPEEELVDNDTLVHVMRQLETMDPREAAVLRMRFGLDGEEPKTLKEIGEIMGVTESRVCQIHTQATARLRASVQRELRMG